MLRRDTETAEGSHGYARYDHARKATWPEPNQDNPHFRSAALASWWMTIHAKSDGCAQGTGTRT
jgi:hypothetical protein